MDSDTERKGYILYDSHCNLCMSAIAFVMKHDDRHIFTYLPLDSSEVSQINIVTGQSIPQNTIVLITDERLYVKSTAILKILKLLGKFNLIQLTLSYIPCRIRDLFYQLIARYRYSIFRTRASCNSCK